MEPPLKRQRLSHGAISQDVLVHMVMPFLDNATLYNFLGLNRSTRAKAIELSTQRSNLILSQLVNHVYKNDDILEYSGNIQELLRSYRA